MRLTPSGARSRVVASGASSLTVGADNTLYAGGGCTVRRFRPSPYTPDGTVPGPCAASLFTAADGIVYYTDARTGAIGRIGPAAPPAPSAAYEAGAAAPTAPLAADAAAKAPAADDGLGTAASREAALLAGVALLAALSGTLAHRRRAVNVS
ncbi:hypothetical protein ACPPVO_38960 [Dactylosporangium sp. McL0621]|uniref:hypothetical protein n=1 Tax=Dactylosporangium sp. McL0621 TaxID=3415678 RepID=UPI003CEC7785